jgi:hypothetical protein
MTSVWLASNPPHHRGKAIRGKVKRAAVYMPVSTNNGQNQLLELEKV